MRLNVGVFGAEQFFGALAGDLLHFVNVNATAVIALCGVALGVFVGEHAARREKHRFADDILGRDELNVALLTKKLAFYGSVNFGIEVGKFVEKHFIFSFFVKFKAHFSRRKRAPRRSAFIGALLLCGAPLSPSVVKLLIHIVIIPDSGGVCQAE